MKWSDEAYIHKGATVRQIENRRSKHFKSAKRYALNALKKDYTKFLEQVKNAQSVEGIVDVIESVSLDERETKRAIESIYVDTGKDFAKWTVENLKGAVKKSSDYYDDYMRRYVEEKTGEKIKSITTTTRTRAIAIAKKVVAQAIEQGLSIDDIAAMLKQHYYNDALYRSVRIARTEVIAASNAGSLHGALSTGLAIKKVWLATKTGHTRDSHMLMDKQAADMQEYFNVPVIGRNGIVEGTEKMLHPGDPQGSPANVINCRCTIVYERIKA